MFTCRHDHQPLLRAALLLIALSLCGLAAPWSVPAASAQAITVYDDALHSPFEDWSWATHDLQATAYVHAGTHAISMLPADWAGLYFHHPGVSVAENGTLELWVNGGAGGGQQIRFYLYRSQAPHRRTRRSRTSSRAASIPAGAWVKATIPFSALGVTGGTIDGLILQADAAGSQPTVYFDDLVLLDTAGPPQPVTINVDPERRSAADQPADLRREPGEQCRVRFDRVHGAPLGRQRGHALQLAQGRDESRAGLVLHQPAGGCGQHEPARRLVGRSLDGRDPGRSGPRPS